MLRSMLTCTVIMAATLASADAAALLSQAQAQAKAVQILKGDPYGNTAAAVASHIKQARLATDGKTQACGKKPAAVWEFHVVVDTGQKDQFKNGVIDGYLALDARTGKLVCANLPLID